MGFPTDPKYTHLIEGFGTTQSWREIPHTGDDWARLKVGGKAIQEYPEVYACYSGTVISSSFHAQAGNRIVVQYWFGYFGVYAHHARVFVKTGDTVTEGQRIGLVGASGKTTGPHLHYSQYTDRARALSGYTQYWKGPKAPKWASVAAWAAASGLVKPVYTRKATAPADPTPPDSEEQELMSAASDIMKHTQDVANAQEQRLRDYVDGRIATAESRMRREVRPSARFMQRDASGKAYTFETSPYAYIGQNASGFIFPMAGPGAARTSQYQSLKTSGYKTVDEKDEPRGLDEQQFFNEIKDVLHATGRKPNATQADARAFWK